MDSRAVLRFAEFELDPENYALTRNGAVIKIAPQPFKVLLALVQKPGVLVTREELRRGLWGDEPSLISSTASTHASARSAWRSAMTPTRRGLSKRFHVSATDLGPL